MLGAVVGTHAGPGTVGLFWFDDPDVAPSPVRVLYSVAVPRRATLTRSHGRLRRAGPAGRAGRGRAASPGPSCSRSAVETLPGVGPALRRQARAARASRRSATCSSTGRAATSGGRRGRDRPALRRRGGRDRGRRAARELRRRRGRLHILTAHDRGRERRDLGHLVQPAVARRHSSSRGRPCGCAAARALRLRRQVLRHRRGGATADFAPVYPRARSCAPKRLRELGRAALAHATRRLRPAAGRRSRARSCRCARRARRAPPPGSLGEAEAGAPALAFEELLLLQLGVARRAPSARTRRRAARRAGRARRALPRRRCRSR